MNNETYTFEEIQTRANDLGYTLSTEEIKEVQFLSKKYKKENSNIWTLLTRFIYDLKG